MEICGCTVALDIIGSLPFNPRGVKELYCGNFQGTKDISHNYSMAALSSSVSLIRINQACLRKAALCSQNAMQKRPLTMRSTFVSSFRQIPKSQVSRTDRVKMSTQASLSVGSEIPDAELSYFDSEGSLQSVSTSQLTKVTLFTVL